MPNSVSQHVARRLRYIPKAGALVEVTCRTIQGRYLLSPTDALRKIVLGVLARAQRRYPLRLHAFVFMSNHYHLLVSVDSAYQLARFMNYVNSNLAREAGRLAGWREKFWGRRYQAIVVSEEEAAQVDRLRYLLSHGCKEGFVATPGHWPGAHSVNALVDGEPLQGVWFDRTREYKARLRGHAFDKTEFANPETLELKPLPCWSHLPEEVYRNHVVELVRNIEAETAAWHALRNTQPAGAEFVQTQHPHGCPERSKRISAPTFHAASKAARKALTEAYGGFLATYRRAAEKLKAGEFGVCFPEGSFPPPRPFVAWTVAVAPG